MTHRILIFDSGVGGFSILKQLLNYQAGFVYFADQQNFPYGEKSEKWVTDRLSQLVPDFMRLQVSSIVVACNTGTVSSIDAIRRQTNIPVFGVEPAVKMLTNYQNPVVWATHTTTQSAKASQLIKSYGSNVRYYTPVGLASAVEHHDLKQIDQILLSAQKDLPGVDAIALSCTHYPLILAQISSYFPGCNIIDPSVNVASHIASSLKLEANQSKPGQSDITYYSTLDVLRLKKQANLYL